MHRSWSIDSEASLRKENTRKDSLGPCPIPPPPPGDTEQFGRICVSTRPTCEGRLVSENSLSCPNSVRGRADASISSRLLSEGVVQEVNMR